MRSFRNSFPLSVGLGLLAWATLGVPALAADRFWVPLTGNYTGAFEDSAHWSDTSGGSGGFSVPASADLAIFANNQATPYVVTFTANQLGADGVGSNPTFLPGFAQLAVRNDKVTFDVGSQTIETAVRIAAGTGENAVVVFNGSGGTITVPLNSDANNLFVGFGTNSTAHVTVNSGVTLDGGRVDGIGVRNGANTTFDINGGHVNLGSVGVDLGPNNNDVISSTTNILVRNGGLFDTNGDTKLAGRGKGNVNVLVDNATWNHFDAGGTDLLFGSNIASVGASVVNVTVQNGGDVLSARNIRIHDGLATDGTVISVTETITGAGSTMRSLNHGVGGGVTNAVESNHDVLISAGGILGVTNKLNIWQAVGAGQQATVTLDTGTIEVSGAVAGNSVEVRGLLQGNGTIRRNTGANLIAVNLQALGTIRPGASPGLITIEDGNFSSAGTLAMELGGTAPSDFDRIVLSGAGTETASFTGGTVSVSIYLNHNAFLMQSGDTFNLVTADIASGTLPALVFTDPHFAGYLQFANVSGGQALQLTLTQVPEPATAAVILFGLLAFPRRDRSPK